MLSTRPILGSIAGICRRFGVIVLCSAPATNGYAASLLFKSDFEGSPQLSEPHDCGTSCWQDIKGSNSDSEHSQPPHLWPGDGALQLLADTTVTPTTVSDYVVNEIQKVMGPHGQQTSVLYSSIVKRGGDSTQTPYLLRPSTTASQGDLYVSYWIKLQPDLLESLGSKGWRVLFEWKTTAQQRLITYIYTDARGRAYWDMKADDLSGGKSKRWWETANHAAPVPIGEWFKFEFFWHRSAQDDGRAWQAINGQVVFDHFGPLLGGNDPIDRIMLTQVYAGGNVPVYQWVDDIEIWDGFPCGDGESCGLKSSAAQ